LPPKTASTMPPVQNAVVVKPPVTKAPEAPKPEDQPLMVKDADRLAQFTRREADFLRKEQEYKTHLSDLDRLKKLESDLKSDPYAVLESQGGDIEKWAKRILNNGQPAPEEKMGKLESQIQELTQMFKQRDENEKRQREKSYVGEYASGVKKFFDGDDYKPVNHWLKAQSALIGQEYSIDTDIDSGLRNAYYEVDPRTGQYRQRENPTILTPVEFAGKFRDEAKVRVEALIDALEKEGLVKRVTPGNGQPAKQDTPPAKRPQATLTNSMESDSSNAPDLTKMTHDERIRYIAKKAMAGAYDRPQQ
jgi:hypothetical protein